MYNIGDYIEGCLGNLYFGGKIFMITAGHNQEYNYYIELPCGMQIKAEKIWQ